MHDGWCTCTLHRDAANSTQIFYGLAAQHGNYTSACFCLSPAGVHRAPQLTATLRYGPIWAEKIVKLCGERGDEFFIKLAFAYELPMRHNHATQCSRTGRKPRSAHVTALSAFGSDLAATVRFKMSTRCVQSIQSTPWSI
jgi:hypothetical protein